MYDLVIQGGMILDGTGKLPYPGDVAIAGERIQAIGRVETTPNCPVLDATGLFVAPGFIDIHSHSDYTLYVDPRAVSAVTQGVTLEVVGNCGHGCAPIEREEPNRSNIYGYQPGGKLPWRTVAQYLDALEQQQPAVNIATLVPNGCLRLAVVSATDRPSTNDELRQMKRMLAQGLEEGAWGYSTGLEYGPEAACSEEEITELCRVAAQAGAFHATHTRNMQGQPRETIEEAIRTAAAAGAPLQISHITSVARLVDDARGAVEQALEQVDQARVGGLDVTFDMQTRNFGMTNLSAALPAWAIEGTTSQIVARLQDPTARKEMKGHQSIITALARGNWQRMVLYNCHSRPELSGKSIAELAQQWDCDPWNAVFEVLLAEIEDFHNLLVLAYVYQNQDIHLAYDHPACMVGSDATTMATDFPLRSCLSHGAFSWASWFYRHFVRDTRRIAPEEAIRRLTSLPASRLGLRDRGTLRPGAYADIAVFNPSEFVERATTLQPQQTADGMRHVLVNGRLAMQDGKLAENRFGRVLRRST